MFSSEESDKQHVHKIFSVLDGENIEKKSISLPDATCHFHTTRRALSSRSPCVLHTSPALGEIKDVWTDTVHTSQASQGDKDGCREALPVGEGSLEGRARCVCGANGKSTVKCQRELKGVGNRDPRSITWVGWHLS